MDQKRKVSDLEVAKKLISIATSAADRGIEFNISFKKMRQLLERKTCYYTGVPFEDKGIMARSIDRADNDRGYVDDNVVACTVYINGKKKDLTIKEIITFFRKVIPFANLKNPGNID